MVDNRISEVIDQIKRYTRIRQFLTLICICFLVYSVVIFAFYAMRDSGQVIKYIANKKELEKAKIEKVMINPKIKFEYQEGQFYDIKAKRAINNDDQEVVLYDVVAKGEAGQITAGQLLMTDNGNNLRFTENPVLVIRQKK